MIFGKKKREPAAAQTDVYKRQLSSLPEISTILVSQKGRPSLPNSLKINRAIHLFSP